MPPVRAFIVDDSALARLVLTRMLESDGRIEVVGEASDGPSALARVPASDADVVLMDMMMPGMDGLEATRRLMASSARPILIVSDLVGRDGTLNFRALQAGALDIVRKPSAEERSDAAAVRDLLRRVRVLAGVPVITRHQRRGARDDDTEPPPTWEPRPQRDDFKAELVCIGASTGGPPALGRLLARVPSGAHAPILVVQHMAPGFIQGMASWLTETTGLNVTLAKDGHCPERGCVYVAPDDAHLALSVSGALALRSRGPVGGHKPSVDALFHSVATSGAAPRTLAVLLTGMGSDGATGMLDLYRAGAWTIAQDEATCVVYGMPKAAAALGAAREVLPLETIADRIASMSASRGGAQDRESVQ